MALTTEQQILIEQKVTNYGKSTLLAYLLWFFLAGWGVHRFYLGHIKSALAMIALTLINTIFLVIPFMIQLFKLSACMERYPRSYDRMCGGFDNLFGGLMFIGAAAAVAIAVWFIVDAFLIPGMVRRKNDELRQRLSAEMAATPAIPATPTAPATMGNGTQTLPM